MWLKQLTCFSYSKQLSQNHLVLASERLERKCLCIENCDIFPDSIMKPVHSKQRINSKYTVPVYSASATFLGPRTPNLVTYIAGVMWAVQAVIPSAKWLTKCFLINDWFLRWAAGSSPWHKLNDTQTKIANRPELVPPFWCCMFTIHKVAFFLGDQWHTLAAFNFNVRWRWIHDIYTTVGGQLMLLDGVLGSCRFEHASYKNEVK